ncbi:AAA family ATPase [Spirochaetota bacterium]
MKLHTNLKEKTNEINRVEGLEEAIESALVNYDKKKRERDRKEKIMANDKLYEASFQGLSEYFLQCQVGEFHIYKEALKGPVSFNYRANIINFIKEIYQDCSKDIILYQSDIRKQELEYGDIFGRFYPYEIGFEYKEVIRNEENNFVSIPGTGSIFFQDNEGFRYVVQFEEVMDIVATDKRIGLNFKIMCNGNTKEATDKTGKFIFKLREYVRENNIFKKGVYDMLGNYIDIEHTPWREIKITRELHKTIDFHIVNFINNIEEIKKKGVKTSRGIILSGNPGNGKTLLGKVLASNMNVPFVWVTAKDVEKCFGPYTQNHDFFDFAVNISPVILFIEDADIYLKDRFENPNKSTLSEFLNKLDGLKDNRGVLTIITANNPEMLDEAVKNRPKRFDVIIEFPNPPIEQRKEILTDELFEYIRGEDKKLINEIAQKLNGFSGAHIKEFAERLKMSSVYNKKKYISEEIVNSELANFDFKPIDKKGNNGTAGFGE